MATQPRNRTERQLQALARLEPFLTRLLPGGFCTLLLGDLGADVIKVEDTGQGDYLRWAPPYYGDDSQAALGTRSAPFISLNRGKRSVRIDLKAEAGRDAFLRLAEGADVVLESFRPGVLDRLGVGYERLRERNPRIVYCAITGYGLDGPNVERAGHDTNYLALNGLLGGLLVELGLVDDRPDVGAGAAGITHHQRGDGGAHALPCRFVLGGGARRSAEDQDRSGEKGRHQKPARN